MTSKTYFSSNVHVLKPQKVSLSEKLDHFLDENSLEASEPPKRYDLSRPKHINGNAIRCAACDEAEYLTREFCRCGHYLRGQLEDEYITWEKQLFAAHSVLYERTELKLRPIRYMVLLGLPFLVVPLIQMAFWADSVVLITLFWMIPALLIFGISAIIENFVTRPLHASARFIENYTFDGFVLLNVIEN